MSDQLKVNLARLRQSACIHRVGEIGHGIEKESLRIDGYGNIAQTPHPAVLGSALTHPHITTDFSEALLEFITPVFRRPADSQTFLEDLHSFVYRHLGPDEFLWTSSMPALLGDDDSIPIAQYGSSNSGRVKTLYRMGLSHRYGRSMQTIAGIHYNFSLSDDFWRLLQEELGSPLSLQDFKTEQYFSLIRNFRRSAWLLIYLFGASPALSSCFLRPQHKNHGLERLDDCTLYAPYGTSLRMGDLGYTSQAQLGLSVSYNSLAEYTEGLGKAIRTPYPDYARYNFVDGQRSQLNDCVLQIENEFYSVIRPKRVVPPGSRPIKVLNERGVEYVEVRCLDLNPFLPVGIEAEQMHFLNAFLLYCALRESPPSDAAEQRENDRNVKNVVNRGRDPALQLQRGGQELPMRSWANEILDAVDGMAALLDEVQGGSAHRDATHSQRRKVEDSDLTPSARVLERMRDTKASFARFALNQSLACSDYFRGRPLPAERESELLRLSEQSLTRQAEMEAGDTLDFESYLAALNDLA